MLPKILACCLNPSSTSPKLSSSTFSDASSKPQHADVRIPSTSRLRLEGPVLVYQHGVAPNVIQGSQKLSPLDHSAILACINPKAIWLPYSLEPQTLRAALSHTLKDYSPLAGRLVPHYQQRGHQQHDNQQGQHGARFTAGADAGLGSNSAPRIRSGLQVSTYRPPPHSRVPHAVTAAALAHLRRDQAYSIVLCNAGALLRVVHAPDWSLTSTFPLAAMGRTGFSCSPHDVQPALPSWYEPVNICDMLGGRAPPLSVRLTQLGCGGCILAITTAHVLVDGRSACMFLHALADNYQRLNSNSSSTPAQPSPCLDRHLLLLPDRINCSGGGRHDSSKGQSRFSGSSRGAQAAPSASSISPSNDMLAPSVNKPAVTPPPVNLHAYTAADAAPDATSRIASTNSGRSNRSAGTEVDSNSSSICSTVRDATHLPFRVTHSINREQQQQQVQEGVGLQCLKLQALPAKPSWRTAIRAVMQTMRAGLEEEQLWPGLQNHLTCSVLHLPPHTLSHLKVLAEGGAGSDISTNDAVTALLWVLICQVRQRPLPGAAPPDSHHALGMAVDLRLNGLRGHLPLNLLANATWCVHVSAAQQKRSTCAPTPVTPPTPPPSLATPLTIPASPSPSTNPCTVSGTETTATPVRSEEVAAMDFPHRKLVSTASVKMPAVQQLAQGHATGRVLQSASQPVPWETPERVSEECALEGLAGHVLDPAGGPFKTELVPADVQQARAGPVQSVLPHSVLRATGSAPAVQQQVPLTVHPAPTQLSATVQAQTAAAAPVTSTSGTCEIQPASPVALRLQGPPAARVGADDSAAGQCGIQPARTVNVTWHPPATTTEQSLQQQAKSLPEQHAQQLGRQQLLAAQLQQQPHEALQPQSLAASQQQPPATAQHTSPGRPAQVAPTYQQQVHASQVSGAQQSGLSFQEAWNHAVADTSRAVRYATTPKMQQQQQQLLTMKSLLQQALPHNAVSGTLPPHHLTRSCSAAAALSSLLHHGSFSSMTAAGPIGEATLHSETNSVSGDEVIFSHRGHTNGSDHTRDESHRGHEEDLHGNCWMDAGRRSVTAVPIHGIHVACRHAAHTKTGATLASSSMPASSAMTAGKKESQAGDAYINGRKDGDEYVAALQCGALRIRIALKELRAINSNSISVKRPNSSNSNRGDSNMSHNDIHTISIGSGGNSNMHSTSTSTNNHTNSASMPRMGAPHELGLRARVEGQMSSLRGWSVIRHAQQLTAAYLQAQVEMAARVYGGQDLMVTSWGLFDYWGVDFGRGGPLRVQGVLCPTPSWAAAIMTAHPSDGGLYCMVVTPTSAVQALHASPVLLELAPGAHLLEPGSTSPRPWPLSL